MRDGGLCGGGGGGGILSTQVRMCETTLSIILYKHSRAFNSKSTHYMDNFGSGGESMCVL